MDKIRYALVFGIAVGSALNALAQDESSSDSAEDDGGEVMMPLFDDSAGDEVAVVEVEEEVDRTAEYEALGIEPGLGVVTGQLYDADSGDHIGSATVILKPVYLADPEVEFSDEAGITTTNLDGQYRMEKIPTGVYSVTISKSGYQAVKITDVQVKKDRSAVVDYAIPKEQVTIGSDLFQFDEIEISQSLISGTNFDLKALRQRELVSLDAINASEMSRFGASDIADALRVIPGVSITSDDFAVIRGLDERYSVTLLNDMRVPSPNPESNAVPLDLFPTGLIENVTVKKTFSPDQWGDVTGGGIYITTMTFPEEETVKVGAGMRVNSNAQDKYLRYNNGRSQWLANGEKDRSMPLDNNNNVPFNVHTGNAPLGGSFDFYYGNTWDVGPEQRIGLNAGFTYDLRVDSEFGSFNRWTWRPGQGGETNPPGGVNNTTVLDAGSETGEYVESTFTAAMSGLLGISYDLNEYNRINFTTFITQIGIDTARSELYYNQPDGLLASKFLFGLPGYAGTNTNLLRSDFLRYQQRNLSIFELSGEHELPDWDDLKVTWGYAHASTNQEEPDFRESTYVLDHQGRYYYNNVSGPTATTTRYWQNVDEVLNEGRFDIALPFDFLKDYDVEDKAELKGGFATSEANRNFSEEQKLLNLNPRVNPSIRPYLTTRGTGALDPQEITDALNGATGNIFTTLTPSEAEASRNLQAAYIMATLPMPENLTLIAGTRAEWTDISTSTDGNSAIYNTTARGVMRGVQVNTSLFPGYVPATGPITSEIQQVNIEPAVSLIWRITDEASIRGSFSQTVARPSFRELGGYFSSDLESGGYLLGNPFLNMSRATNYDVRFEWFDEENDDNMFAISFFFKEVDEPIEVASFYEGTQRIFIETWVNNPDTARIKGVEFEFRRSLNVIDDVLKHWSFGGNFSFIDAKIDELDFILQEQTSSSGLFGGTGIIPPSTRQLYNQPEYILNLDLRYNNPDWGTDFTLAYYMISDVLSAAGNRQTYNIYTGSYDQVNATISQTLWENWVLKFEVDNIFDSSRTTIFDPTLAGGAPARNESKVGQTYSFSLTYNY